MILIIGLAYIYELKLIYRFAFIFLILLFFREIFYLISLKLYGNSKNKKDSRLKKITESGSVFAEPLSVLLQKMSVK